MSREVQVRFCESVRVQFLCATRPRSLRDVCSLVEELFSDENRHLLSLCGMVNTHTPAGRMLMMNLANYNQFEREMIAERTRDALQHMKAQGVRLGHAPYGYEYGKERDERGRRVLVPVESEQVVIAKMVALRNEGLSFSQVAQRLNDERVPARRGGRWRVNGVRNALIHDGKHSARPTKRPGPRLLLRYDPDAATERAKELRALAGIAGDAAPRNVLARHDSLVVDDVFPRRPVLSRWTGRDECDPAVDALSVSSEHLAFQRFGNLPAVHLPSMPSPVSA